MAAIYSKKVVAVVNWITSPFLYKRLIARLVTTVVKKSYSANCNIGLHFKLMVSRIWVDWCTERGIVLWGDLKLMWFEADVKICTYYPSDANSTTKLVPQDYHQFMAYPRIKINRIHKWKVGSTFKPFTFKFFLLFVLKVTG